MNFLKFFIFGKNDFQDRNVKAFLRQNDASDEIDRVGTLDNSTFFDAN